MAIKRRIIVLLLNLIIVSFLPAESIETLFQAIEQGDLARVKELIARGIDVNATGEFYYKNGVTPLHAACAYNKKDIVAFLLRNGADVNKGNETSDTPCTGPPEKQALKS